MSVEHHKPFEKPQDGKHAWTALGETPEGQTWDDQMKAKEQASVGSKQLEDRRGR